MKTYIAPDSYSSKKNYAVPCLAAMAGVGAAVGAAAGAIAGAVAKAVGGNKDFYRSPSIQRIKD